VRDGRADFLLATKIDRVSRSVADFASMLRVEFRQVPIIFIDTPVETSSAVGRFQAHTLSAMAELERELIGERTREALAAKRRKGFLLGQPPYGYRHTSNRRKLVPVPEEQRAITRARDLRRAGYSLRAIGRLLDRAAIAPRRAARWSPEAVSSVLGERQARSQPLLADITRLRPVAGGARTMCNQATAEDIAD
jgi:DNA invertase Pin-like site-specific DNA recombinase